MAPAFSVLLAALLAATAPAVAAPVATSAPPAPQLAITIDDIPAHGPLPPGADRKAVVDAIVAALRAHAVPAQGFYNRAFGIDDPQSPAVVAAWRSAGFPLGNHGYSHLDLDTAAPTAFIADAVRNEAPLAAAMPGADWHWFRYPFLHEGATVAARVAVRSALRQRGYRIAAVTMSFGDYAWNAPYARCAARNDRGAVAQLEDSYLTAARAEVQRERRMSAQLYGRDIPYVLLLHLGAFDAHMLPRLLDMYETLGFQFVPLSVAEQDRFYASAIDLSGSGPSPTLDGAMKARGLAVADTTPQPGAASCS